MVRLVEFASKAEELGSGLTNNSMPLPLKYWFDCALVGVTPPTTVAGSELTVGVLTWVSKCAVDRLTKDTLLPWSMIFTSKSIS